MGQSPDSATYNDKRDRLPFYQGNADFGESQIDSLIAQGTGSTFKAIKICNQTEFGGTENIEEVFDAAVLCLAKSGVRQAVKVTGKAYSHSAALHAHVLLSQNQDKRQSQLM